MRYQVTKRYGHNEGWSATFRQWRAKSHCNRLHGYALAFEITFETEELDDCNWCLDFGSLKPLKGWLQATFDHRTLIAEDDPHLGEFQRLTDFGLMDLLVVPAVGCEMFARMVLTHADALLRQTDDHLRVRLISVKIQEHEGNTAICFAE